MSGVFAGLGRVLMVGCGNMGGAMLARWLASGLDPTQVTVFSPSGRAAQGGVEVVTTTPAGGFDTVVLAMKPQQLGTVAVMPALSGHTRLSAMGTC